MSGSASPVFSLADDDTPNEFGIGTIPDDWEIVEQPDELISLKSISTEDFTNLGETSTHPDAHISLSDPVKPICSTVAPQKAPGLKKSKGFACLHDLVCKHRNIADGRCKTCKANLSPRQISAHIQWPMEPFGHLQTSALVIDGIGRFTINKEGRYIGEHVDADGNVDFILTVLSIEGTQVVTLGTPYEPTKLPAETARALPFDFMRTYLFPEELTDAHKSFYREMANALEAISAKTAQIDFQHVSQPDHHAKLMYNGDFYMYFPNDRTFMRRAEAHYPEGVGEARDTTMTPVEAEIFTFARESVTDYHNMFRHMAGKHHATHRINGSPSCHCFDKITVVGQKGF
uniref:HNHc domain-containing protein n=1 Tax=Panagrellus redivivus TaxID=6233 RepID=A0A7E4WA17_PANRE